MARNSTSEVRALIGPVGSIDALLRNVDMLAEHGVEVPPTFRAVRAAWDAVRLDPKSAKQKLADAIAAGRVEEVPGLLTAAAISGTANLPEIRNAVARDVRHALLSIWQAEASEIAYEQVAGEFDEVARKLTACGKLVDIQASADSLIGTPQTEQKAWLSAREYAVRLDELLPLLAIAAELFPVPANQRQSNLLIGRPDDWLLSLTVDPGVAHRRQVWEAWEQKDAIERWGGLLTLGVTLRAHPQPHAFEVYQPPAPVEVKTERGVRGVRQFRVDPEDALYAERVATENSPDAESGTDAPE